MLSQVFNVGVKPGNPFEVNKNLKIINTISFYGMVVSFVFAVLGAVFQQYTYALVCLITFLLLFLVVYLNYKSKYSLSKVLLMTLLPLVVVLFSFSFGPIGNEYYLLAEIIFLFFLFRSTWARVVVFTYLTLCFVAIKVAIFYSLITASLPFQSLIYFSNVIFSFVLSFLGLNLFFKEHIKYQALVESQFDSLKEQHAEISDQKNELEKLNLVKDKLFSVVSHDLRGPLQSLITLLDMFSNDYIKVEHLKEQIPKISEKLNNTTNLMENLLYWVKSQLKGINPIYERFNLLREINTILNLYGDNIKAKQLKINIDLDSQLEVETDKEMLKTILRNLLHNAIKFSRVGGVIALRVEKRAHEVLLSVSDRGQGIEPHFVEKFNRNEAMASSQGTEGETGAGLGLMLVKEFLMIIEGDISLDSELGKGSTFTVRLRQ